MNVLFTSNLALTRPNLAGVGRFGRTANSGSQVPQIHPMPVGRRRAGTAEQHVIRANHRYQVDSDRVQPASRDINVRHRSTLATNSVHQPGPQPQ